MRSAVPLPSERALKAVQLLAATAMLIAFAGLGLDLAVASFGPSIGLCFLLYAIGHYLRSQGDRAADMVVAVAMLVSASLILSPAQYASVATGAPLIDGTLAAADDALGGPCTNPCVLDQVTACLRSSVDLGVFQPAAAVRAYPQSLDVVQSARPPRPGPVPFPLLRRRDGCGAGHLSSSLRLPTLGFESVLDQARFISQFNGTRSATDHADRLPESPGPHQRPVVPCRRRADVLLGCSRTSGCRRQLGSERVPDCCHDHDGAHDAVDVPVTVLLFAVSLTVWGQWRRRRALTYSHTPELEEVAATLAVTRGGNPWRRPYRSLERSSGVRTRQGRRARRRGLNSSARLRRPRRLPHGPRRHGRTASHSHRRTSASSARPESVEPEQERPWAPEGSPTDNAAAYRRRRVRRAG